VDGTETGWGRPAEPAPRWRALLGRGRHGSQATEEPRAEEPEAPAEPPRMAPSAQPLPTRSPIERTSIERRPYAPLEQPSRQPAERPVNPLDRRPVNPLDRRSGRLEPRPAEPPPRPLDRPLERPAGPLERPVNPLDSRRPSRLAEGFHGRGSSPLAEPEQPHSYFNPPSRPGPPPLNPRADLMPPRPDPGYPPARAAASVGSAQVMPAPAALPVAPTPTPTSPAAARIEWRQARPEQDLDRAVQLLRRKLGKPRVLAFANPKGGVHKTTATVLAAATIGSVRGRGVLAWDDNELRGTLGLRAGSARHARTIRHLIGDLMQIENMHGEVLLRELDDYLRHASDGSYDVLAGEENPRFAQRLDQSTVHRVMELLRRTHDVICVDTGNNVESVNWQTVMKAADQLVITTVPREDAAFTADWMLDLLNETGMEELAANAVTLISCPTAGKLPLLEDFKKHFATRTRGVAVVPYDPALEVGSSIEYAELQPETRVAWMRAAALMIEPFAE
jgi:MinD-like ATPase involved in chromosome partitioning or flagellar assembly